MKGAVRRRRPAAGAVPRARCARPARAGRGARRGAGPARVREAGQPRLQRGREQGEGGEELRRRRSTLAFAYDRKVVVEAGRRRARDRGLGAGQRRAARPRSRARSSPTASSTTTTRSTRRTARPSCASRRPLERRATRGGPARWACASSSAVDACGYARVDFLMDRKSGQRARERDQHHPRLHVHQHVPQALGGHRPRLRRAAGAAGASSASSGTRSGARCAPTTADDGRRRSCWPRCWPLRRRPRGRRSGRRATAPPLDLLYDGRTGRRPLAAPARAGRARIPTIPWPPTCRPWPCAGRSSSGRRSSRLDRELRAAGGRGAWRCADARLRRDPDDARARLARGAARGVRSRFHLFRAAPRATRRATAARMREDLLARRARAIPSDADALFGLGLYDYYADVLPRVAQGPALPRRASRAATARAAWPRSRRRAGARRSTATEAQVAALRDLRLLRGAPGPRAGRDRRAARGAIPGWPLWGLKLAEHLRDRLGAYAESAAVARAILAARRTPARLHGPWVPAPGAARARARRCSSTCGPAEARPALLPVAKDGVPGTAGSAAAGAPAARAQPRARRRPRGRARPLPGRPPAERDEDGAKRAQAALADAAARGAGRRRWQRLGEARRRARRATREDAATLRARSPRGLAGVAGGGAGRGRGATCARDARRGARASRRGRRAASARAALAARPGRGCCARGRHDLEGRPGGRRRTIQEGIASALPAAGAARSGRGRAARARSGRRPRARRPPRPRREADSISTAPGAGFPMSRAFQQRLPQPKPSTS